MILALLVVAALGSGPVLAQSVLGAQDEEGEPNRRRQWLVPSPDPARPARALLFRPPGAGPRRLADAFREAGGWADFHVLPAYGGEGHGCRKARMALISP
ncbi:hypothetical protein [Bradyrhizobium sp. Ai1a-2]|uniref:hypothetical protein n=1 Tax=Bradyrhizobium sp. Ai1a-2 TaxID=196490 RepID=UPI00040DE565|nr:hypothetical protein [Bradyrhizobium sp. Ai1a-2]